MLAPIIPHICEEMWTLTNHKGFISQAKWPKFDKKSINETIEFQWLAFENLLEDISAIQKLLKKEKLEEITLIEADEWKSGFVKEASQWIKDGVNIGDMMKKAMANAAYKPKAKEIKGVIDKIAKNPGKYGVPFATQDAEAIFFEQNLKLLEKDFKAKVIVVKEAASQDPKAKMALPGKPAIMIK